MAEVEAGEQGHMADDQPQRGVGDVQAGEPEIDHVAEFAAIVLTCKGRGEAERGLSALLGWGILDLAPPPRSAPSASPSSNSPPPQPCPVAAWATAYWVCLSEA